MIRSLEDLTDASVVATDGEIGKIRNFLFDDQSWKIRYLVVDVGSWLTRREVVIAVSAIEMPDWERKVFRARLSREQIRHSPDLDSKRPVSRQQEIAMSEYYGWPGYWEETHALEVPFVSVPVGRKFPVHTKEDPHLRSAKAVAGYEVWEKNAQIGRLEHFILDEASWDIGYLDVRMGDWLHNRAMLVPRRWVESVSWPDHRVNLNHPLTGTNA